MMGGKEMDQVVIGRPSQDTIKDCYSIGGDITRRMCVSASPLEELKYLIDICDVLWDMHVVIETNEVKKVVLKTEKVFV